MIDIEKPKIEIAEISEDNRYGKFICEPLEARRSATACAACCCLLSKVLRLPPSESMAFSTSSPRFRASGMM